MNLPKFANKLRFENPFFGKRLWFIFQCPSQKCSLFGELIEPWLVEDGGAFTPGVREQAMFCFGFLCNLQWSAWTAASCNISKSDGGISQNIIFKTLRQSGTNALYLLKVVTKL